MFDLDTSIATWRSLYAQRRVFSPEDLDELTQHLKDQINDLIEDGRSEEEAFNMAVREMGHGIVLNENMEKFFGPKPADAAGSLRNYNGNMTC